VIVVSLCCEYDFEHYVCHDCNKVLVEDDFLLHNCARDWSCPECNGVVRVYTDNDNMVYLRKYAHAIEKGDMIQIRVFDKFTEGRHAVIAVEKQSNGKYGVALNDDDWVNCELGSWSGDISEFRHK
jgi:phage FluMu protein Com